MLKKHKECSSVSVNSTVKLFERTDNNLVEKGDIFDKFSAKV
jgi:hypothetical protein